MKVICALCDKKEEIDDTSIQAKKIRNHPILMYICDSCNERIKEKKVNKEDKDN